MVQRIRAGAWVIFAFIVTTLAASPLVGQGQSKERLIVSGDLAWFLGPGKPLNCTLNNRYKRGDPVGFRVTAINGTTGERDRAAKLVVHVNYLGKTIDLPMRDHEDARTPDRKFWVAKWIVPNDAPPGIVRFAVTAQDPDGRTGEWKPFEVDASQLTIIE